jgi:signal transduction histidine kinase
MSKATTLTGGQIVTHTRVLIVDDDRGARLGLQRILCNEGFDARTAESGAAALEMVREDPPDVVLTDLQMPGMDGIDLCRAVKELDADLPVVVVTAFGDTPSAVGGLRAGAADYLAKPVDVQAVCTSVQRAVERRAAKIERELLRERTHELYQQALSAVRAYEGVLSIVSHDLRTSLNVVSLQAQRLAKLSLPSEQHREISASILRATDRMDHLIADLLDASRVQSGHLRTDREVHPLSRLLGDVSDLRPLALQKQIDLQIQRPPEDRPIFCDRARIGQVFANLVANAIKFSPEKRPILVFVEDVEGGVRFGVRDEGAGIAPDVVPRIFDRFWRSDQSGSSSVGLGLYIAKGIVDGHGGRIWVESQLGVGSTFYVLVPDALGPTQRSREV